MANIFSKILGGLKKAGETYMEVGALTNEVMALESRILTLRSVLPSRELNDLLAHVERIKQAAKAVVR